MSNIAEKIIKPRLGVLELAKQLGNVSKACKTMGIVGILFIDINPYTRMVVKKHSKILIGESLMKKIEFHPMLKKLLLIWL